MRNYSLYLLKEDVATEYYGKESLLYHLFSEYNELKNRNTEYAHILEKQVRYITHEIPTTEVKKVIEQELENRSGFSKIDNSFVLKRKHSYKKSFANLTITDEALFLNANGNYEAETIFFEILRKFAPCFLAMDYERDQYGWLNPIKQRKFV